MSVISDINLELIEAMKAKDEVRVMTLRLLVSAIKNKQIEVGHELTDEETTAVIVKNAKQRKESVDAFEKAGRTDLSDKEKAELEILGKYLPAQMSEEEISKSVDAVLAEIGQVNPSDMGKVIGQVMTKIGSGADGNVVSKIVREKIAATPNAKG